MPDESSTPDKPKKPTLLQIIGSIFSAIFGIQTNKNRERDFTEGNAKDYIGVYIVIVILIVIAMFSFVKVVLHYATA